MLELGHGDVIAALASALQERDRYTGEHSESVVDLTARVGEALALDSEEISRVRTAALLHDIGKVGVPDEILHKPGPLTEREWEIMRQHPAIGERILRAIPGLGAVARIVRHEHERWDGKGYPDGLAGAAIPVGSRIILACDAYHAMTSDRPYRKAMHARRRDGRAHGQRGHPVRPRGRPGARRLPVRAPPGGPRRRLTLSECRVAAGLGAGSERPRRPRASPRPTPAASRLPAGPL